MSSKTYLNDPYSKDTKVARSIMLDTVYLLVMWDEYYTAKKPDTKLYLLLRKIRGRPPIIAISATLIMKTEDLTTISISAFGKYFRTYIRKLTDYNFRSRDKNGKKLLKWRD